MRLTIMQDGKQNDKIIIYAHLYSFEGGDHGTHPNG
jgi:hypothetical protein